MVRGTSSETPSRIDTAVKAALSLVPYVGGALAVVYEDYLARRKARVASMAEEAFSRYPGSYQDLLERMKKDPRFSDLFVSAAEAAARTSMEEKARALGNLLADAASTDGSETYDEKELLVRALSDLEWPHIHALKRLGDFPDDAALSSESNDTPLSESDLRKERLEVTASVPTPVLAALVRHGLVGQESGYGLYVTGVTVFGRELLEYLEAATHAHPPEEESP